MVYVMSIQETLQGQSKKLIFAIFRPRVGNIIVHTVRKSSSIFGGFITGKIIDSAAILIVQLRKPGLHAVDRKVVRQLGQIKEVHIAEIAVHIVQIIAVAQIKLRNAWAFAAEFAKGEHFGFVYVADFCLRKVKVFNNPFAPAQINFLKVAVHEYIKEEEGGAVAEIQHFGKLVILKIQFRNVCAVEKINGT